MLSNPPMAARAGESFHLSTLLDLVGRDRLFADNDPPAVSSFHAGLELPPAGGGSAASRGRAAHPSASQPAAVARAVPGHACPQPLTRVTIVS